MSLKRQRKVKGKLISESLCITPPSKIRPSSLSKCLWEETDDLSSPISLQHALSFDTFPEALAHVEKNMDGFDSPSCRNITTSFPNYSPMTPMTPTYCRVLNTTSPFGKSSYRLDESTCSLNSSFSRPLPDQSVFNTSVASSKTTPGRNSPICPPTPVRQPAWIKDAHPPGNVKSRRNSLATSKILLSLPNLPQEELNKSKGSTKVLNDFENLGWLGCGSFAEVFKMRCVVDDKVYAVKKSKRQFRSKRDRARLLQEIRIYEKFAMRHNMETCENIIQYYRAWQEDGYVFIQTELCECGTVKDFTEALEVDMLLPETTLWYIINEVAKGLAFIHEANIVHLDIKPTNLFIAENGMLKIGDFGTAMEIGQDVDDGEGDVFYMAKEVLSSNGVQTSADIFSFGITLYELATSVGLPSDGPYWHDLRDGRSPRIPLCYSSELDELIQAMMHTDPKQRPSAYQVLHQYGNSQAKTGDYIVEHIQSSAGPQVVQQQLFENLKTSNLPMAIR